MMITRQHKRSFTRRLVLPFLAVAFVGYFAYHTFTGSFGIWAMDRLEADGARLTAERDRLSAAMLHSQITGARWIACSDYLPDCTHEDDVGLLSQSVLVCDESDLSSFYLGHMRDDGCRSRQRLEIDREAEIETRQIAHTLRLEIDVDCDIEGRLHAREGGDDLAPDMLDGG